MSSRRFFLAAAVGGLTLAAFAGPAAVLAAPVDEMPSQMRRAFIVGIQEELQAHGYRPGPADGRIGGRTVRAIRRYQRDAGLPVDGVASSELLDHLKFVRPAVYAPGHTLDRPADSSRSYDLETEARPEPEIDWNNQRYDPIVADIQRELMKLGYYRGRIDGLAGPKTRSAARDFAATTGLRPGVALDAALLARLREATAPSRG